MAAKNALISVFDKTNVAELAKQLSDLGWNIFSSGGTAKAIAKADVKVTDVADMTGLPAILGHRVVTLHPKVHGGILAIPDDKEHQKDMSEYDIHPFGLVVGNLYPFNDEPSVEMIDIGGPAMVRAAAKNHAYVGVLTNPSEYPKIIKELKANGTLSDDTRKSLAIEAFAHTANYDLSVVEWLSDGRYTGSLGQKVQDCDYGENRWQSPAALYSEVDSSDMLNVPKFKTIKGRSPSFINWTDVDRLLLTLTQAIAIRRLNGLDQKVYIAVAVKHGNPCGAAVASTPEDALKNMLEGNPRAVFGAVMMTNFKLDKDHAELLMHHGMPPKQRRLLDGICAPQFSAGAVEILGRKDGKYFLATNPELAKLDKGSIDENAMIRPVRGGFLSQPAYRPTAVLDKDQKSSLSDQQLDDILLGIAVCATSNSNTVTLVKNGMIIGNGVGQQDRVGCCELAIKLATDNGHDIQGSTAVSDSFFPFPDGPELLINSGVSTIFATSGSKKDGDTQQLCQDRNVTLVQIPDAVARMFFRH